MSVSVTENAVDAVQAEVRRRGLTQHDIGRIIGKSQGAAWRRMARQTPFTLAELEALATHFDIPLSKLLRPRSRRKVAA